MLPAKRNVTWRESECGVTFNGSHFVGSAPLRNCGTTITIDEDTVTFSNDLIVHTNPDLDYNSYDLYQYAYDDITLGEDIETTVPVKCVYSRHINVTSKYNPVKQNIRFLERRFGGDLEVMMEQYNDPEFTKVVSSTAPNTVALNDDVYIKLGLVLWRGDLHLQVDSCIATSTPAPSDANWRLLVKNGCAKKPARMLSTSNDRDVKFAFKAFDFRHNGSGVVYIHCEVYACKPGDQDCASNCETRTRRAATDGPFSGSHLVSTGPLIVSRTNDSVTGWSSIPIILAGVASLVAMVAVVAAILGWSRKVTIVRQGGI